MDENKNLNLNRSKLIKAYGVLICFVSIYLSLNLANVNTYDIFIYPARALTWLFCFFFGSVFTYLIYFLLFIYGIYLITSKNVNKKIKISFLYAIGGILIFIGGSIIIANLMCNNLLKFDTYGNYLLNNIILTNKNLVIKFDKNCGIIGLTFCALFNTLSSSVLTYIISSCIFFAGLILVLFKPLNKLRKFLKDFSNFNKNFDPEGEYTKAKDITLVTTTINVIDDDYDIKADHVKNDTSEKINSNDIINASEEDLMYNKFNSSSSNSASHFNDKPISKAIYQEESSSKNFDENYYEEKNDDLNNFNEPNVAFQSDYHKGLDINDNNNLDKPKKIFSNENNHFEENKIIKKNKKYVAPSINLLETRISEDIEQKNIAVANERSQVINEVLKDLNVKAQVVSYKIGPSVTRYDIKTDKNESIRGFDSHVDDICIRLGGISGARFTPIVQGKTTSGLEISNVATTMVNFKDCMIALNRLTKTKPTSIAFGKDINNELLVVDLQDMPHLLVSGTTGSGKSIFVHSLIMTLIMRSTPEELKLLLIDPKTVEFNKYREIPHLLCPPISIDDVELPYEILKHVCEIMDQRYKLFSMHDCSKLKEYNEWAKANNKEILPIIVVIVDEYADLVDSNKKISEPIVRIGQKARAAGIHMVIATQRPSVNVINGVIKANIPSRVALLSSSYVDSNTILDAGGAEKLIGNGDMLIKCAILSNTSLLRCQGSFVSNSEIKAVCDYLRNNYSSEYDQEFMDIINKPIPEDNSLMQSTKESRYGSDEDIYQSVKNYVMSEDYVSMSKIQNSFGVGFNRASRLFKRLQSEGVISTESEKNSAKGSKVLIHNFNKTINENNSNNGSIEQTTFVKK